MIDEFEEYLESVEGIKKVYLTSRVIKQIQWYDDAAKKKQKRYKSCMIVSILLTAVIPCLSLFTGYRYGIIASIAIAVLSAASSAILSIVNLCELQKLWIEYRANCEILKSVLHRYLTRSREFSYGNEEEQFQLLVEITEKYLVEEYGTWSRLSHSDRKES
ncbi:hypothetical protein lbkm_0278 [Lachnospiraceae bacterium KM106-2]|nr:hypothetical protein lbkm_0278 [Lachnospiraceae bacterium KM106-2]